MMKKLSASLLLVGLIAVGGASAASAATQDKPTYSVAIGDWPNGIGDWPN